MELIVHMPGPITFQTQLIGDAKFDEKMNEYFVGKYQTIKFNQLDPIIEILYTNCLMMQITITAEKFAYYDIKIKQLTEQLI